MQQQVQTLFQKATPLSTAHAYKSSPSLCHQLPAACGFLKRLRSRALLGCSSKDTRPGFPIGMLTTCSVAGGALGTAVYAWACTRYRATSATCKIIYAFVSPSPNLHRSSIARSYIDAQVRCFKYGLHVVLSGPSRLADTDRCPACKREVKGSTAAFR